MKITILELRKLIRDQVERNMRLTAGMFSGGGITKSRKGVVQPPPGLDGNTDEEELIGSEHGEEQEKSQSAVRVYDRAGGEG